MYFFDQGADITPEQLVDQIEKRLAAGKYHVTLSHMWNNKLPGRMDEYYQKTERFAQLLVDRKIPFLTMKGTLEARFGKGAVVGRLSPLRRGTIWEVRGLGTQKQELGIGREDESRNEVSRCRPPPRDHHRRIAG